MSLPRKTVKEIRANPSYFFEDFLGCDLWSAEKEIIQSVKENRKTSVRTGHSVGKTYICGRLVIWFLFAFPKSVVITTAPTGRQVRNQLWKEIRAAHANANKDLGGKILKTKYEIDEDWFAIGFTVGEGDDASDKFQGWHADNILIVVDEASGVQPQVYNAIEGVMAGGVTVRLLLTGNPLRNSGNFADSWSDEAFNAIHIPSTASPNVKEGEIVIPGLATQEWVEEMKAKHGEDSDIYRVRVLGQPPKKESDALIGIDVIEKAQNNERAKDDGQEIIGVDPARFGDDKTAFVYRRANYAEILDIRQDQDTMKTAGQCMEFLNEFPEAQLRIDVTGGLGAGVYDRLKEQRHQDRVRGVNVAAGADKDRYYNLRTEGWYDMKDWLKTAILHPSDKWDQLAHPRYEIMSSGKNKLEPKEKMKKRGVSSPDVGDALALTFQRPTEGGQMTVEWI